MANNRNGKRKHEKMGKPLIVSVVSFLIFVILAIYVYSAYQRGEESPLANLFGANDTSSSSEVQGEVIPEDTIYDLENLQVWYIDVGQGDSQLIRVPNGEGLINVLIDTGEYQYSKGLVDFLKEHKVEKLDYVITTHPHADHMGGMARVIESFEIGSFYMPHFPESMTPTSVSYEKMLDALSAKGLLINDMKKGTEIVLNDKARLEVLSPEIDSEFENINNYSAVTRLTYEDVSFLFTGDIEKEAEIAMLDKGYDLSADVLAVPHHGSASSSTAAFLDNVSPYSSVISCGKDNQHGHPNAGVIDRLADRRIMIFRTDEHGSILLKSNGKDIWVIKDEESIKTEDVKE